ncbi:AAA family ATPase [Candidatus Bathyarchaeota archaeon]|nr:AAA family ATPase [Candidatus Bathyarchaeota archaeon]
MIINNSSITKFYLVLALLTIMFLSRIEIKNFRCLKDVKLELAPITVIYGENGSGKSSVLEAIQLLRQGMGYMMRLGQDPFKSPVDFGSYTDIVSNNNEEEWITIGLGINLTSEELINNLIYSDFKVIKEYLPFPIKFKEIGYELSFRQSRKNQPFETKQTLLLNDETLERVEFVSQKGTHRNHVYVPNKKVAGRVECTGDPRSLLIDNTFSFSKSGKPTDEVRQTTNVYNRFSRDLVRIIREMINKYFILRPTRATPRLLTDTAGKAEWVGVEGEDLVRVLSLIFGNVELERSRDYVTEWARTFGLDKLHAGYVGNNRVKATFKDPIMDANNDIVFAGHGSKQILVVLTQIFHSKLDSTIAIEEPEISLHLNLQLELPKLFAHAKRLQKQIIVTSHSGDFLTAFKPLFSEKALGYSLTKNELSVYHLRKSQKGSSIERLTVLSDGRVKGFVPSIVKAEKKMVSSAL